MASPKNIIIVGGGLAGLTSAILLQKAGFEIMLFEKKPYPFHRVCGEYISNEALPFLKSLGLPLSDFEPSQINHLIVTTVGGHKLTANLSLGGFGLSRYTLDNALFELAVKLGVDFHFEKVTDIEYKNNIFEIKAENGVHHTSLAIAAHGKRSNLDQKLKRSFFYHRSPYLGVKYHIKTDLPTNLIRLDNFSGGYSGVCKIEGEKFNLCYLSKTANLKNYAGISEMEKDVLHKNPYLKHLFENSEFITEKPEVINEISFEPKTLIENHLLFCGDAAGMITPLCGNGMAMAIHSAKILSGSIIRHWSEENIKREDLEREYVDNWSKEFAWRLFSGRAIQRLFGRPLLSEIAVRTLKALPGLNEIIVKKTHGRVF